MPKILIVDDDPDIIEACTLILTREGYDVSSALNRDQGMQMVTDMQPDILILDVMMEQPDDGIAMAQELRRKGFKNPIMMLTSVGKATGFEFDKDDEIVPVDVFEEKPIEPSRLLSIVKELLPEKEG
ncbi:response regulator transcription factor [bacterium]|nr:response regulator transcription factor [candidate division CSSED10-310 bacterium]